MDRSDETKVHRNAFLRVQRMAAIRIACAFRTTSTSALLIIRRTPPIHLLAVHRAELENEGRGKKQVSYENMMKIWQEEWSNEETTASWTRCLICNIESWVSRSHGEVDFYLTQVLSRHGYFEAYFKRFQLRDTNTSLRSLLRTG